MLARLLTPADFGVIALIMVVIGLANLFQDLGLTSSVVRAREVTAGQQSSLFLVNAAFGATLFLALFLCAPLLADFYNNQNLLNVARALSPIFLISALIGQARATLQRDLRFTILAAGEVLAGASYFIIAVVLALANFGYWALVIAQISSTLGAAIVIFIVSRFRFTRVASFRDTSQLIVHGAQITAVQVATYFSRTLDVVVIGRYFTAGSLGFYNRASQVVNLVESQFTGAIALVTLPIMARLQDDELRFNQFLNRAVTAIGYTLVPAFFALSLTATPLVTLVYGPQWVDAGPLLSILALAGTVRCLLLLVDVAATALAVMSRQLIVTVAAQIITGLCLVLVVRHGLTVVAVTYVCATGVAVVISASWICSGTLIRLKEVAAAFLRPFSIWFSSYSVVEIGQLHTDALPGLARIFIALGAFLTLGGVQCVTWPAARRDVGQVFEIVTSAVDKPGYVGRALQTVRPRSRRMLKAERQKVCIDESPE